jgi:hypothetical protein
MKVFPKPARRSPFKRKPLRFPGQSVQDEMNRLLEDRMVPIFMFATVLGAMAFFDWMTVFGFYRPQPWLTSGMALAGMGYGTYKFFDFRRTIERLRLARDGERIVGQYLETLRADGARVFHDLVGDGFNVDHVVVSRHGIFVLETKSYMKPGAGDVVVQFDGERLIRNGVPLRWNPVRQARALGKWLDDQLFESTGRRFPIRLVVLLPGWFVQVQPKSKCDVWVLNPKQLSAAIDAEAAVLRSEDLALVSSRIIKDMQKL